MATEAHIYITENEYKKDISLFSSEEQQTLQTAISHYLNSQNIWDEENKVLKEYPHSCKVYLLSSKVLCQRADNEAVFTEHFIDEFFNKEQEILAYAYNPIFDDRHICFHLSRMPSEEQCLGCKSGSPVKKEHTQLNGCLYCRE